MMYDSGMNKYISSNALYYLLGVPSFMTLALALLPYLILLCLFLLLLLLSQIINIHLIFIFALHGIFSLRMKKKLEFCTTFCFHEASFVLFLHIMSDFSAGEVQGFVLCVDECVAKLY